ncbi:MAG: hypothetical protein D6722_09095, partial [Bacteroidetes bacterium]
GQDYAGTSRLFTKMSAAGVWWSGRNHLGAEALGIEGVRGTLSPQNILRSAHALFAAGANHLYLAGPEPRWEAATPPARQHLQRRTAGLGLFAAEALPALNQYLARCQYMLRQGQAATDVWVYYPFLGFPPAWANEEEAQPAFGAEAPRMGVWPNLPRATDPRVAWLREVQPLIAHLEERGLNWTWVNDEILQQAAWNEGHWQSQGLSAQLVVLADLPHIEWETAHHLYEHFQAGAPILTYGNPANRQPGFMDYQKRDQEIAVWMQSLAPPDRPKTLEAFGDHLLTLAEERPLVYVEPMGALLHHRSQWADGSDLLFFANEQPRDRVLAVRPTETGRQTYWLDPWSGAILDLGKTESGQILRPALPAYRAGFLLLSPRPLATDAAPATLPIDGRPLSRLERVAVRTLNQWDLLVPARQGQSLFARRDTSLFDWRGEPALQYAGSEGRYSIDFEMGEPQPGHRYLLDLGEVQVLADLCVNTYAAGQSWVAPHRVDITPYLNAGLNTLEIWVQPPPRNRWVGLARQGEEAFEPYRQQSLLPAGLLGPVRVWEVREADSP